MKNPFFLLSAGLLIVITGFIMYRVGQGTRVVPGAAASPVVAVYERLSPQAKALYFKQSDGLAKAVPERIVELDEKTIGCFGPKDVLAMQPAAGNLGGQCCGALMSIESYNLQLQSIARFVAENGGEGIIPPDPYDVSVTTAQELTRFDADIALTPEEQAVYDEAVAMSHHGGPCCCKCWKWYVMSGVAKKLLRDAGWNAHQIAQMWDISSSCGHAEDTDMFRHYDQSRDMPAGAGHGGHS